jgi:hypothetical protein
VVSSSGVVAPVMNSKESTHFTDTIGGKQFEIRQWKEGRERKRKEELPRSVSNSWGA